MPFDRAALAQAVAAHGTVARIVLVQVKGSAPRPAGTSMLVWAGGASGTIGGGQLELQSMRDAAAMLAGGPRSKLTRAALGPAMNQCCGGAVTVVTERFDAATVEALPDTYPDIYLRAVDPAAPPLADSFRAKIDRASGSTTPLAITQSRCGSPRGKWSSTAQAMSAARWRVFWPRCRSFASYSPTRAPGIWTICQRASAASMALGVPRCTAPKMTLRISS